MRRTARLKSGFLMSTANAADTFDLRCYVREKMLDYLQREHPSALPKVRSEVALSGTVPNANGPFE
jgi:hypothetical protein